MIGDGNADILAGLNAGCHTALISSEVKDYGQEKTFSDISGLKSLL